MTRRHRNESNPRPRPAGWAVLTVVAAMSVVVGGCADDNAANASAQTVVDAEVRPALDGSLDESPADEAAGDAAPDDAARVDEDGRVPTTAAPTDPSADAIDAAATNADPGDRTALERVLAGAVDPVTGVPLADLEPLAVALPERWTRNSRGAEIRLDDAALLACANNQFAWVDLRARNVDSAAAWLGVAAVRADHSLVAEVKASAAALAAAALDAGSGQAVVEEFLTVCTERGFEV